MVIPAAPPPIATPPITSAAELQTRQAVTKTEISNPVLPTDKSTKSNKAKPNQNKAQPHSRLKKQKENPKNNKDNEEHQLDLSV